MYEIETYYLWVILALGFPGNCATIVTVLKMSPARSLTVYIALLAVVDNLAIINKLLIFVLMDNRVPIGEVGCKVLGFGGNFLITFGNWLLVAMSIERFAAVWFPMKVGQMWTFKKSLVAVVMLSVPLCGLFLHLLWIINIVEEDDGIVSCDIHEEYRYFMMHVWYWVNVVVYAVVPCILLLVFNVLIVTGIVKSGKLRKQLKKGQGKEIRSNSADRNRPITIMLVTAALTLVVLTTPRCVMLILTPYWVSEEGTQEAAIHSVTDTMAYILCDSTHAINFYIYSLSAKRFRNQFLDLVLCRKKDIRGTSAKYTSMTNRTSIKSNMISMASMKEHESASNTMRA